MKIADRPLDLGFVRGQFPALDPEWALFDNAGGSVPAAQVIAAAEGYMRRYGVQHGASYAKSQEAVALVAAGRAAAAALVNAAPDEVVVGGSSTANAATLARSLRPLWREGDEVVVTNLDHEANIGPWRVLEATGIRVREWCFDPATLALEPAGLEALLNARTRLVCFTHCSNLIGSVHDAAALNRMVHAAGALSCIDGVAFAPHRRVDVQALDADFYLLSLYKAYGPHLGLLYGRRELLRAARGQNHFFIGEEELPYKLEPGGPNHELTAALAGITAYFQALDEHHFPDRAPGGALERAFALIQEHEQRLVAPLLDFLAARPGVRLLGRPEADAGRVPTVSFVVEGVDSATIPPRLDAQGIAIRFGHFYAHRAVAALGLHPQNGVVRASMVHYNSPGEVERLVAALDAAL